jgi:hypothetical protein
MSLPELVKLKKLPSISLVGRISKAEMIMINSNTITALEGIPTSNKGRCVII